MMKQKTHPFEQERFEALITMMDHVKAVLDGKEQKPGGEDCLFPHCQCNLPYEKCEKCEK